MQTTTRWQTTTSSTLPTCSPPCAAPTIDLAHFPVCLGRMWGPSATTQDACQSRLWAGFILGCTGGTAAACLPPRYTHTHTRACPPTRRSCLTRARWVGRGACVAPGGLQARSYGFLPHTVSHCGVSAADAALQGRAERMSGGRSRAPCLLSELLMGAGMSAGHLPVAVGPRRSGEVTAKKGARSWAAVALPFKQGRQPFSGGGPVTGGGPLRARLRYSRAAAGRSKPQNPHLPPRPNSPRSRSPRLGRQRGFGAAVGR